MSTTLCSTQRSQAFGATPFGVSILDDKVDVAPAGARNKGPRHRHFLPVQRFKYREVITTAAGILLATAHILPQKATAMDTPDLRMRILQALEAIELAKPPGFRAAFDFLAVFLPGAKPVHDPELAEAFQRAISVLEEGSANPDWQRHEQFADEGNKPRE